MAPELRTREDLLREAEELRWGLPTDFRDRWVEGIYAEAARLAARSSAQQSGSRRLAWETRLDRLLTSRWTGFPIMILVLAAVLWLTITGANIPSAFLSDLLIDHGHAWLHRLADAARLPSWLSGALLDGVYLATAWVVSVMLPPMAIFFPLFTILEDFGYLPRVAFNLDGLFRRAGAHGKQALTMTMGWGCNAAGVVATRVIDSPRERLIAIITNNFSLCNGRWPTQILMASVFVGALAPSSLTGTVAAGAVLAVALLGVGLMFFSSWLLSRTVLKGEASAFNLELPPYRPPRFLRTLYTSLIDRTLIVLWRAVVFAAPSGLLIWLLANVHAGGATVAEHMVGWLEPAGWVIGLNGVIILAYLLAIPANEIVVPTILMLTVLVTRASGVGEQGAGVMFAIEDGASLMRLLQAAGWTTLTAVCLMLFSLCHNPCSTTIFTIYKETRSLRWTTLATLLPLVFGVAICGAVALVWRLVTP